MSSYWIEVVTVLAWTQQNTMQRAMWTVLEWPQSHAISKTITPLHIGRMKLMASEVFKILNKPSPSYIQDFVNEKVSHYNFRNKKQVEIPQVNSKRYGMKSFQFEAAQVWNSLPSEFRMAENYQQFRRLLRTWDCMNCKCTSCSCWLLWFSSYFRFKYCNVF